MLRPVLLALAALALLAANSYAASIGGGPIVSGPRLQGLTPNSARFPRLQAIEPAAGARKTGAAKNSKPAMQDGGGGKPE